MKHSCNTARTSPKSSNSDSGNRRSNDLNYSSDSSFEEYYLNDQDHEKDDFAGRFLLASCEAGYTPWDSDPVSIAKFLQEINEKHGMNIPINMDVIKERLSVLDRRVKKMRLYQSRNNKTSHNESPSTFGASTSYSPGTQTSDNMVVDEEKNVDVNTDVQENSNGPIVTNQAVVSGREAGVFVIRRVLSPTDIDEYQCRLSMPCNQVRNIDDFLTRDEVDKLSNKSSVPAKVIDSSNRIYDTNLRRVKSGLKNHSYAIGKPWNKIKTDNGFEVGTVIEVRVFRDGGELCFSLDRVG